MYDLDNVMARLPVLEKAMMAGSSPAVTCDAVSYWPYQQETPPYWWNRVASMAIEPIASDIEIHRYNIEAALVIAHISEGYKGGTSQKAYKWIAGMLSYWRDHRKMFDGVTYTTAPDYLWIEDGGATITGIPNGTRTLANSGIGVLQVAVVFTIEIPLVFKVH